MTNDERLRAEQIFSEIVFFFEVANEDELYEAVRHLLEEVIIPPMRRPFPAWADPLFKTDRKEMARLMNDVVRNHARAEFQTRPSGGVSWDRLYMNKLIRFMRYASTLTDFSVRLAAANLQGGVTFRPPTKGIVFHKPSDVQLTDD